MQLHVDHLGGKGTRLLCVQGEVHFLETAELESHIRVALEVGCSDLVVDISGVSFLTSEGLGALLRARREARRLGGDLRLTTPPEPVLGIFRATALTRVFPLVGHIGSAQPRLPATAAC